MVLRRHSASLFNIQHSSTSCTTSFLSSTSTTVTVLTTLLCCYCATPVRSHYLHNAIIGDDNDGVTSKATTNHSTTTTTSSNSNSNSNSRMSGGENNTSRKVIVIGGGLAGLSAAIEAASCNASVIMMEKTASLGGNSAKATSGINGCRTPMQLAAGVRDDSYELFADDTFKSGQATGSGGGMMTCNPKLVGRLTSESTAALEWLTNQTKLDLSCVLQLGGHSRRRTHRVPDTPDGKPVPVGFSIMSKLRQRIEKDFPEKISIMTNTHVTSLIRADNNNNNNNNNNSHTQEQRVVVAKGVKFRPIVPLNPTTASDVTKDEEHTLVADAVILATGGFSNDHTDSSLLDEFAPHLAHVPTTNGPFATGDGVKMARAIGASLRDMEKVQLHPTGFIDPSKPDAAAKFLGPEALRGSGGILLAPSGERFVNELGLRSEVSEAIWDLNNNYPGAALAATTGSGHEHKKRRVPYAFVVLNQKAAHLFGHAQLSFYRDKMKLFRTAKTFAEIASLLTSGHRVHQKTNSNPAGSDTDEDDELLEEVTRAVARTIEDFSTHSLRNKECGITGRTVYPCTWSTNEAEDGPYEVAVVTPCIHYTMGGVAMNSKAQVVVHRRPQNQQHDDDNDDGRSTEQQKPPQQQKEEEEAELIQGLYAAGEVTGGVHGANRLAGNSLLECVVFGRAAGAGAAGCALQKALAGN